MQIKECMTASVRTIRQGEPVARAAQIMRDSQIGFLPVINLAGAPMGVITDRDIAIRIVADGVPPTRPVHEVMSESIYRVDAEAPVEEAIALMKERNVGRLVVTNAFNQVVGVFSLGDAAVALGDHVIGNSVMEAVARHSHAPAMHPLVSA